MEIASAPRQVPGAKPVVVRGGIFNVPTRSRLHITSAWGITQFAGITLSSNVENGDPANSDTILQGQVTLDALDLVVPPGADVTNSGGAGFQGWLEPNFG